MTTKYQGFSPIGVLLGFCTIVLTFATAWFFELNRGAIFFTLIGWVIVLFGGTAWLRSRKP
jgi:hypothetical protein